MWNRLIEGIYMPHGYCLLWEPWLVGLHAISDVLTFGAYSAIPLAIWMFVSKRPNVEMKGLARLFAAFILWCGLTHLFGAITLWYPVYELQGLVKAATAVISVTTAFLIFPLIPKALAIPSPKELQIANAQLEGEIAAHKQTLVELQRARGELEERVAMRTKDLAEATARFKALFEYAPVAMLMVDRSGSVQQMNAAAENVFGSDRGDLLGKPVEMLLPEELKDLHPALREDYVHSPAARPMGAGRELFAQRKNGERFPVEIGLNPIPGSGEVAVIASVIDISERRKQAERVQVIMRELSHRSKNLLAVIKGMVRQAIASSPDMQSFERSFGDRLQGLAQSHDLLVGKNWEGVSIADLVKAQLAFLRRGDWNGISVAGPDITLTPQAVQNLGLALHELATNAAKHGALQTDTGTIDVTWSIRQAQGAEPRLELSWKEAGGPVVAEPQRRGFGRTVLEQVVPKSVGGSASLTFPAGGLQYILDAQLGLLTKQEIVAAA
jgi:PAS domain S-box-containing protein